MCVIMGGVIVEWTWIQCHAPCSHARYGLISATALVIPLALVLIAIQDPGNRGLKLLDCMHQGEGGHDQIHEIILIIICISTCSKQAGWSLSSSAHDVSCLRQEFSDRPGETADR